MFGFGWICGEVGRWGVGCKVLVLLCRGIWMDGSVVRDTEIAFRGVMIDAGEYEQQ